MPRASAISASAVAPGRAAGGAREEDHALGVAWHLGEALDELGLAAAAGDARRHGGPHAGVELAAERLDQLPLLLGHRNVALGEHDLAMTGLHTQKLHRHSIMANRRARFAAWTPRHADCSAPAHRGEVEHVDGAGAGADVAQAARDGVAGERARDPRGFERRAPERELRGEHRGVGAAGAVRGAVGDGARRRSATGSRGGVEEQVARAPRGARRSARPHPGRARARRAASACASASSSSSGGSAGAPASTRASGRFGVSTLARGRICSRSATSASGASRRAPDSATITGSTTTGVPGGQLVEHGGDGERDLGAAEHADLDGVDADVGEHGADLGGDDLAGQRVHGRDRDRVLRRDRGDRARPVHAAARERLQVRLDPGAAAGVGAGDREGGRRQGSDGLARSSRGTRIE